MNCGLLKQLLPVLGSLIFLFSCKEEISPIEKFIGVYDYYEFAIPGPDADGNYPSGEGIISIRKLNKDEVSLTIYEYNSTKVYSPCAIETLDSTFSSYRHYARIVIKSSNTEIGKIRDWDQRGNPSFKRVMLDIDFAIEANRKLDGVAIKRRD